MPLDDLPREEPNLIAICLIFSRSPFSSASRYSFCARSFSTSGKKSRCMIFSKLCKQRDNRDAALGHSVRRLSSGPATHSTRRTGTHRHSAPRLGRWQVADSWRLGSCGGPGGGPRAVLLPGPTRGYTGQTRAGSRSVPGESGLLGPDAARRALPLLPPPQAPAAARRPTSM